LRIYYENIFNLKNIKGVWSEKLGELMPTTPPVDHPLGPDLRGRLLADRFRLGALIGRGGTSGVYAATDTHMRRQVAVKVIHPEHARSEEQRRRIRQEARIGGVLEHPNLTPVLDFGEGRIGDSETLCFLVMPLLKGRTLNGLVGDGNLTWRRSVGLARQLLAAVSELHRSGALHRDLKASNCMVTQDRGAERLRVLDFGLVKLDRPDLISVPPHTSRGPFVGTLAYAAPEQVLERPVDARADLYAVGMILYYMLARRLPFSGTDYEIRHAVVEKPPPPPRTLAPTALVPAALEMLVLRALAKDPADRFARAEDFDDALVELLVAENVGSAEALRPCPSLHRGTDDAQTALAAWTCFDYDRAREAAKRAATSNRAWSPLSLLMSLVPDDT